MVTQHSFRRIPVLLPLLFLLFGAEGSAQPDWNEPDGEYTRPRTLLTPDDIVPTHERLNDPFFREIYAGIYQDAIAGIPEDNNTTGGRRARASAAKNAAFVYLIDRAVQGDIVSTLTSNERSQLRQKLVALLNDINTDVPGVQSYTEWQWHSKELIDYLCAYDMALGGFIPAEMLTTAKTKLREFTIELHAQATFGLSNLYMLRTVRNNHALMTASAIGMAGVVLNEADPEDIRVQPRTWVTLAIATIDDLLWRTDNRLSDTSGIAGYAEGPHYLRYAALNMLPFFRAYGNVISRDSISFGFHGTTYHVENPATGSWYDNLWEWIARIRTPNGLMPPLEDTFIGEGFPELALTGNPEFVFPIDPEHSTFAEQLNSTVDMRANFVAAGLTPNTAETHQDFQPLTLAGNIVFRNSWDTDATWMHLFAENGVPRIGGGGHNQADDGSFCFWTGGQMMALDPGYVQYNRREEVGKATNHNMILVDGEGPAIGMPGIPGGADVVTEEHATVGRIQYARINTAYNGATITRHGFMSGIGRPYGLIVDFVRSDEPHDYTFQLHGNGLKNGTNQTGTMFEAVESNLHDGRNYRWNRNGATMLSGLGVRNGVTITEGYNDDHEEGYDRTGTHSVVRIIKEQVESTEFHCVLSDGTLEHPYMRANEEDQLTTVISNEAIISTHPDTLMREISSEESGLGNNTLRTDAQLIIFSVAPLSHTPEPLPGYLFMHNGTSFEVTGHKSYSTSTRTDFLFASSFDHGFIEGWVADPTTIHLPITTITTLGGDSIGNVDVSPQGLEIELPKGGYYYIITTSNVERPGELAEGVHFTQRQSGDQLIVSIEGELAGQIEARLYDVQGRELSRAALAERTGNLDLRGLPSTGTYLLALVRNGNPIGSRIIGLTR